MTGAGTGPGQVSWISWSSGISTVPPTVSVTSGLPGSVSAFRPLTSEIRRTCPRDARCSPPALPPENTTRVFVAEGAQPLPVRFSVVSIAFHSWPPLAQTGEAYSFFVISPSGRAHVVERAVRSSVASTGLPVLRANEAAAAWLTGCVFGLRSSLLPSAGRVVASPAGPAAWKPA